MLTKKCPQCKTSFPRTYEYFSRGCCQDGLNSWCWKCSRKKSNEYFHKNGKDRVKATAWMRAYVKRLYDEMIAIYGGKCKCCGDDHREFLTLHHVGGTGKEHRAQFGGQQLRAIQDLRKRGWPQNGFQLLCWNCHRSIDLRGYCPHQHEADSLNRPMTESKAS